jgi:diamine N-acetyltransferase
MGEKSDNESRQVGPGSKVTLREITGDTVRAICRLSDTLSEAQSKMVAPNAVSIAQAYFEKYAWFRAIYADDTPVGFLMLYDNPDKPEYYLWRMMIADQYQGMGFGKEAMFELIEYVKTRPNATVLETSCVPWKGGPEDFYLKLGFKNTGEWDDVEMILRLPL